MNYSAGFRIFKDELRRKWKVNSNFSNAFVSLNTSVIIGNMTMKLKNLTLGLPTKSKDVKILYEKNQGQAHKFKLYLRENEQNKWECNTTLNHNRSVLWKCKKLQVWHSFASSIYLIK